MWRRFAITRLALAQRANLVGELAAHGIQVSCVVIGDDANLETAEYYGFDVIEQSNEFLGRKFNDGFQFAAEHGADYVVTIGSDDWVHPDLFARLPQKTIEWRDPEPGEVVVWDPNTPEIVTGREILLVDMLNPRAKICRSTGVYGVIPWIIPTVALEPSGFRPVPEKQERGIDGALIAGLKVQPEWVFVDPHPLCRVDFKSDVNLNTYDSITRAIGDGEETGEPWKLLAEKYPEELVRLAVETCEELRVG